MHEPTFSPPNSSAEHYRRLMEMATDWFWEQDADFRFTYLSRGIQRSGSDPARMIGLHRWDLDIDWTAAERETHRLLLESHQPFSDLEYRVLGGDREWRWYSINGEPMFDKGGSFVGYCGTGSDVTERKRVELELKEHRDHLSQLVEARTEDLLQAKLDAERASQIKSDFLANMSHELRTPLHAILSFAHLGQTKGIAAPPDKVKNYFDKIHAAGDRLLKLVNDLLDLSKLEAGKMILSPGRHDLAELVRDIAGELEPLLERQHLHYVLPASGLSAPAEIDVIRFAQVLRNLISNAIKFSRPEKSICIQVEATTMPGGRRASDQVQEMPAWRIAVLDQGVGIPETELESIFDKFVQSSKTRTGAGGTGLGLSICKEIIEAHRGQIRAYNRSDGGAVFEILIPHQA